jgi:hypothetical protein
MCLRPASPLHSRRHAGRASGAERQTCSHKIEFRFLNGNLIAPASQLFIFSRDTFLTKEAPMFGNSIQGSVAESSFLYLMMAATYFRQASRARHPHVRDALRDLGREYVTNAHRVAPVHTCPGRGLHPLTSNTQS